MNVFYLDPDPKEAARFHCNKHVVKMVTETAQLLSTAHRVLDGTPTQVEWTQADGKTRRRKLLLLEGEHWRLEESEGKIRPVYISGSSRSPIMAPTHVNHPQAVWVRSHSLCYYWAYHLFEALLTEYTRRYARVHACARLLPVLKSKPSNMICGQSWVDPPLTMPDRYKREGTRESVVESYRAFYVGDKARFAKWPDGETPTWFQDALTLK